MMEGANIVCGDCHQKEKSPRVLISKKDHRKIWVILSCCGKLLEFVFTGRTEIVQSMQKIDLE